MKETDLFARIRPHLAGHGEYDRVENSLGSGMPDIFYNLSGITGWIETKLMRSGLLKFEKFQPNWIRKHNRAGLNRIFVVAMDERETIHVWYARDVISAPATVIGKWVTYRVEDIVEPELLIYRPYNRWDEFRQLLKS
jgi:hypothetical protein